jgi:hypothetical protein
MAVLAFLLTPGLRRWDKGAMIAWRTLACSVSLLCLVPGCGDDGETGSGFSTNNQNSNTNNTTDTSSGTDTSTGAPGTSTTTGDPTTGPDTTTSTTIAPTTNGPTSTTLPDTTTTGDTDTSTTGTQTSQTTQTTDPAGCGNGQIDPNEQCDGANLNGFTCESLGNAGGSLGCDPVTCTFDTSLCMGNSSSGTSG